jgi:hypothetical protein
MNRGVAHPNESTVQGITAGTVRVEGIEVTQAIQDMSNSVKLVAGKVTVARVYLSRPRSWCPRSTPRSSSQDQPLTFDQCGKMCA